MKNEIIVHSSTYEGNPKSGDHLAACYARHLAGSPSDLCEIKVSLHFSFTPAHLAVMALSKALEVFNVAVALEKHVREAHADGSICPVASISEGMDWIAIENTRIVCEKEKDA